MEHPPSPDPDALADLIAAHRNEVYGILRAIVRRSEVAEELAQEVFLLALRKGVRPGPELSAWFRKVARNLALNEMRRKQPVARPMEELARCTEAVAPEGEGGRFEDELVALRQCLAALPEADRRLLAARYEGERPLAQLAGELGQSEGYLKQRLFRLRAQLAECIRLRLAHDEVNDGRTRERQLEPRSAVRPALQR